MMIYWRLFILLNFPLELITHPPTLVYVILRIIFQYFRFVFLSYIHFKSFRYQAFILCSPPPSRFIIYFRPLMKNLLYFIDHYHLITRHIHIRSHFTMKPQIPNYSSQYFNLTVNLHVNQCKVILNLFVAFFLRIHLISFNFFRHFNHHFLHFLDL